MKAHIAHPRILFGTCLISIAALASSSAYADVKYRVGYDETTNQYSIYMTPDSVPSPDVLVSSQVTLVAPVQNGLHFSVQNIQSFMPELVWNIHSRVDTPVENMSSDYLSFGSISTGSMPQPFGWVAGEEKKIFSFTNPGGCVDGVSLIESDDPFNTASNSAQTNPGNYFSNLGWSSENNYTGNYGDVVNCSGGVVDDNDPDDGNDSNDPSDPDGDVSGHHNHNHNHNHGHNHGHNHVHHHGHKHKHKHPKLKKWLKRHVDKHIGLRDRKEQPKRKSLYILP